MWRPGGVGDVMLIMRKLKGITPSLRRTSVDSIISIPTIVLLKYLLSDQRYHSMMMFRKEETFEFRISREKARQPR